MSSKAEVPESARPVNLTRAAAHVGVSRATLMRAVRRGELKPVNASSGRRKLYSLSDVERLFPGSDPCVFAAESGVPELGPGDSGREHLLAGLPYLARTLVNADYAALTLMGPDGQIERMYASGMSADAARAIGAPPRGGGVLGRILPENEPLLIDNLRQHPGAAGIPAGHPDVRSVLGVPVESGGRHAANLYVANSPGRQPFTDRDLELIRTLARYASTALENVRLYQQEAELRKHAEEAEQWLDAVIRGSHAGVLVVDAESGKVVLATEEAQRVLGAPLRVGDAREYYESVITYRNPNGSPIDPEDLPLQTAIRTGEPSGPTEIIFDRPDGRRVPAVVSAAPVFSRDHRLMAAIAVFQDVTRMKELDDVKSDFLSMVTHDLRSPLATMKGLNAVAIAEASGNPELVELLADIDDEVDQMMDLVSNLLDMSRIEAGSYPLELEESHLRDIADDAVRRARRSRLGEDREIILDVPADLPLIYADPSQLGRVLDNLLSNALKYSENRIALRSRLAREGSEIITEVVDHGIGVTPRQAGNLFDKFFRVTRDGRKGRGAGLGLAICKAIAEAHGGKIGVRSRPGQGSTFWFTVPVRAKR